MKQIKKSKRFKKRYIFMFSIIFLIAAGMLLFVFCTGNHYTFTYKYFSTDYQMDESKIKFKISDESIVKAEKVYVNENNKICIDLVSQKRGDTSIRTYYGKIPMAEINIHVDRFGIILEKGNLTFNGYRYMEYAFVICIAVVFAFMAFSYIESFRRADFSYSMVIVGGVLLFMILTFITTLADPWFWHIYEYDINTKYILIEIFQSGFAFISITTVPVTMLAVALGISNVWLVIKEGFRPQNILGIITGIIIIGGILIIHMSNYYNSESSDIMYYFTMMTHIVTTFLLCYFECMLISTMFCAVASTKYKPEYNMDYIIILGCAIRKDGTPTPILRGRIQRAFDFERKQYEKTGRHAKFVPSGGQGSNEVISEAESMKRCLMEMGVPEADILKEDKSVNTYQNMAFSKKIIEQDAGSLENINIGFSTTNYHVFRGYTLAHKTGMTVKGLSAKTKLYFFPNAFVREFIGLLWEQKLRHIMVAVSVIIFMILMYLSIIY